MNYKILIATISSLVFTIIAACLWAGISMREVTVVEHPYEDGLKYESTQKKKAELGWQVIAPASIGKDGQLEVTLHDRNSAPLEIGSVQFALNRLASSEVKQYQASRLGPGKYGAVVNCPLQGYWEIKVKLTRGGDTFSYDSRIHIDG